MGWAGMERKDCRGEQVRMANAGQRRGGWAARRGFPAWRRDVGDGLAVLCALLSFAMRLISHVALTALYDSLQACLQITGNVQCPRLRSLSS